jgi:hypothetical protein
MHSGQALNVSAVTGLGLAKPLILRLGAGLSPVLLFVMIAIITGGVTWFYEGPMITPIILAYMIGFINYLEQSHRYNLAKVRPVLKISAIEFEQQLFTLSHFPKWRLRLAYFFSVPMMFFVNWTHPDVQAFLQGQVPGVGFFWGLLLAIAAWVVLLQVSYIVISNTMAFADLARSKIIVDIFDIRSMLPLPCFFCRLWPSDQEFPEKKFVKSTR